MARLGFFGRISRAIGRVADAIADVVNPGEPRRAPSRMDREAKRFARGKRTSGKAAERYARQRRDAEATRRAQRQRKKPPGPPKPETDFQRRRREAQERERAERDRQRARERDPYLAYWRAEAVTRDGSPRTGYLEHRDFFNSTIDHLDLDADEKLELWYIYLQHMVSGSSKRNSITNPFFQAAGLHPDNFDWWGWREAMGYPHSAKTRR